jgi:ribosomal protein S2
MIEESAKRYMEYSTIHLGNHSRNDQDYEAFNTFMERDETRFLLLRKESIKLEKQLSMMSSKKKKSA